MKTKTRILLGGFFFIGCAIFLFTQLNNLTSLYLLEIFLFILGLVFIIFSRIKWLMDGLDK